jgi:D-alanyl-D-alanine carboxypeptidase
MRNSLFFRRLKHVPIYLMLIVAWLKVPAQGFSTATTSRLQAVIDSFQNNPANPYIGGISAAIQVEGLAKWKGATGYASRNIDAANNLLPGGTPFTTQTLSRAYSVTKTFTSALVQELAHQGVFSLDAPLTNWIPLSLINPGLNPNVTIRQLLAHESGYSDFLDEINLQIAVAFEPTRTWAPYETLTFAHQENPPGLLRKYSSTNYIILGMIVEAATGKPVEQHFRERFFDPLHLNSMYLAGREPIGTHGSLAAPHDNISALDPIFQLTGQPTFPDAYTNIGVFPFHAIETISFTTGGIVSTASDLAEWGTRLFGGTATSTFTRNQMVQSISSTPDEDGDFLGYGLWRTTKISNTEVFIGHDGSATGYRSVMFYQPDRKMTIAVMTNYHGANLYLVAKALFESIPQFTCGNNGNPDKVVVCRNGHAECIARPAAINAIRNGAYLGPCAGGSEHTNGNNDEVEEQGQQEHHEGDHNDGHHTRQDISREASLQAYPNPVTKSARLSFTTPVSGKVVLEIFTADGQKVKTLYNGWQTSSQVHEVSFYRGNLEAGIYIVRFTTPKGTVQQKLVITR